MGATENQFHALAEAAGLPLERQVAIDGLTNRGHVDPALKEETSVIATLASIHEGLGGNPTLLADKRSVQLKVDFFLRELDVYIELDEVQHFTSDRLRSLAYYSEAAAVPDVSSYRSLIAEWHERADAYRAAKRAADFPAPGGRRAQRAYLDAVRDLVIPALGHTLIRLPAPECDPYVGLQRLRDVLGSLSVVAS